MNDCYMIAHTHRCKTSQCLNELDYFTLCLSYISYSSHPSILISVTCLNGGTCTNTNGSFVCTCPPEYTGQLCEFSDCGCGPGFECETLEGMITCFEITSSSTVTINTDNLPVINNHANTLTENQNVRIMCIILHYKLSATYTTKFNYQYYNFCKFCS